MNFCGKCKKALKGHEVFCPECGAKVVKQESVSSDWREQVSNDFYNQQSPNISNGLQQENSSMEQQVPHGHSATKINIDQVVTSGSSSSDYIKNVSGEVKDMTNDGLSFIRSFIRAPITSSIKRANENSDNLTYKCIGIQAIIFGFCNIAFENESVSFLGGKISNLFSNADPAAVFLQGTITMIVFMLILVGATKLSSVLFNSDFRFMQLLNFVSISFVPMNIFFILAAIYILLFEATATSSLILLATMMGASVASYIIYFMLLNNIKKNADKQFFVLLVAFIITSIFFVYAISLY